MSSQQFLLQAQFAHNVLVAMVTFGIGLFILIVVEYFRRK